MSDARTRLGLGFNDFAKVRDDLYKQLRAIKTANVVGASYITTNNVVIGASKTGGRVDDSGIAISELEKILKIVETKSGDYTLTSSDNVIIVDATSQDITIDTPAAVKSGREYTIIRKDDSANAVTVDANSTGNTTLNGDNTQSMPDQYDAMQIIYDGTEWFIR